MDEEDVVHGYTYIIEYFSAIKKNEMPFAATRMDLERVILSKVSHREGEISYDIPQMRNLKRNDINELTK